MGRFVGKQADGYETRIGRPLPGYELLHLLSRAQLLARLPERARLLSVGCGAGGELAELAGLRPGWRFVAADLSADMLALARQRCARLGLLERIELHCGDVAGLPPAPPCDAALVLLVLHFLRGDQAKRRFLEAVAERLAPAAPLLLANLMEARTPSNVRCRPRPAAWPGFPRRTATACCNACARISIRCPSSASANCWKTPASSCPAAISRPWATRPGSPSAPAEDASGEARLRRDLAWVGQQLQQRRASAFAGAAECGGEVGAAFHLFGVGAEGSRQGDEVGLSRRVADTRPGYSRS